MSSRKDWEEWSSGRRDIELSEAAPALGHLPTLFKRRLSQLSRMVLHVGHELSQGRHEIKVVFASAYGEIGQQVKLTASLLDSGEIAPSVFSFSVFNAPVALLSIAEANTDGNVALSAGAASFESGLLEALARQKHADCGKVLFIAADELVPMPFRELAPSGNVPYALGLLLRKEPDAGAVGIDLQLNQARGGQPEGDLPPSALRFLLWFLGSRREPLTLAQIGYTLTLM